MGVYGLWFSINKEKFLIELFFFFVVFNPLQGMVGCLWKKKKTSSLEPVLFDWYEW